MCRYTKEQLVEMVRRLIEGDFEGDEADHLLQEIERAVPDPYVSDYIYYSNPQMTPQQVIDKALSSTEHVTSGAQEVTAAEPLENLVREALKSLQQGDVERARQLAEQALALDETNDVARQVYYVARRATGQ